MVRPNDYNFPDIKIRQDPPADLPRIPDASVTDNRYPYPHPSIHPYDGNVSISKKPTRRKKG